jgi:ankyrin repeat protein
MELSDIDRQLFRASAKSNIPMIRYLLRIGANIDAEICMEGYGCGYTPLTMAIWDGHFDSARELIERGANVDAMSGKPGEQKSIYQYGEIISNLIREHKPAEYVKMQEILHLIKEKSIIKAARLAKLNVPSSGTHTISQSHNTDPITLNKIESGEEVYFFNNDPNPYSKNAAVRIINAENPISPITRQPIVNIKRYTAEVPSGGKRNARKRSTRKQRTLKGKRSNRKRTTRKYR